jgi:hypothetical protein
MRPSGMPLAIVIARVATEVSLAEALGLPFAVFLSGASPGSSSRLRNPVE